MLTCWLLLPTCPLEKNTKLHSYQQYKGRATNNSSSEVIHNSKYEKKVKKGLFSSFDLINNHFDGLKILLIYNNFLNVKDTNALGNFFEKRTSETP